MRRWMGRGRGQEEAGQSEGSGLSSVLDMPLPPTSLRGEESSAKKKVLNFGLDGETFWWKMPRGLVSSMVLFYSEGKLEVRVGLGTLPSQELGGLSSRPSCHGVTLGNTPCL